MLELAERALPRLRRPRILGMKRAFGAALLVLSGTGKASEAVTDSVPAVPEAADAAEVAYIAPALEIFGANLGMAAVNKYVRGVQYAHIDGGTVWHNLAHEWVWDDNNTSTPSSCRRTSTRPLGPGSGTTSTTAPAIIPTIRTCAS